MKDPARKRPAEEAALDELTAARKQEAFNRLHLRVSVLATTSRHDQSVDVDGCLLRSPVTMVPIGDATYPPVSSESLR
jgi:isopentenyl diphosphate isomerase/L-lactate dehydrogenase-like FMN-dependent dehydrogenase